MLVLYPGNLQTPKKSANARRIGRKKRSHFSPTAREGPTFPNGIRLPATPELLQVSAVDQRPQGFSTLTRYHRLNAHVTYTYTNTSHHTPNAHHTRAQATQMFTHFLLFESWAVRTGRFQKVFAQCSAWYIQFHPKGQLLPWSRG